MQPHPPSSRPRSRSNVYSRGPTSKVVSWASRSVNSSNMVGPSRRCTPKNYPGGHRCGCIPSESKPTGPKEVSHSCSVPTLCSQRGLTNWLAFQKTISQYRPTSRHRYLANVPPLFTSPLLYLPNSPRSGSHSNSLLRCSATPNTLRTPTVDSTSPRQASS